MAPKRLVFVTSRLLWPIDNGRKTSLNYYCKALHEVFGWDVYLYCFPEKGQKFDGVHPEYIKEVKIASSISWGEKFCNVFLKSFLGKKWPFQCSLYYSRNNADVLLEYCEKIKPQVIITEMIRTSTYIYDLDTIPALKISNLDDLLSKRYRRQVNVATENANIAGAYSNRLPKFLETIIRKTDLKKLILRLEANRCEKWERILYRDFDYTLFTSPIEANEINTLMKSDKAHVLSVGVDYEELSRPLPDLVKIDRSMSLVGNFKFAPNCESLHLIATKILPKLEAPYTLNIIGYCPDDVIAQYVSNKSIHFIGRVEDLASEVRKTEVFLSPIAFGTGIKTKIVEAMAMGMPVLTNDVGAEGIMYRNYEDLIVENDYEKMPEILNKLFTDCALREKIGKKAQNNAYQNFRWEVVFETFREISF